MTIKERLATESIRLRRTFVRPPTRSSVLLLVSRELGIRLYSLGVYGLGFRV